MNIYRIGGRIYEAVIYLLTLGKEERVKSRGYEKLGIKPGDQVLDWGCGTGYSLRYIFEALQGRGTVYAVESSPNMLKLAVGRFPPTPDCAIHFVLRSGHGLHLCNCQRLDAVVASYSLSGAEIDDYSRVIGEIRRHLEPGGRLMVIDHYVPEAKSRYDHLRHKIYVGIASMIFGVDFSPKLLTTLQETCTTIHLEFHPEVLAYCWIGEAGTDG